MKKILRLVQEAFFAMVAYRSPFAYYAERLGFLRSGEFTLRLRSGSASIVRAGTTDIRVLNEIWNERVYDPLLRYIHDGATVVDIGANIGAFSVKAARCARDVRVLSVEPLPANVAILKKNIALNKLADSISVIACAIAGSRGSATLFTHDRDMGGGSLYPHGDPKTAQPVTVSTVTLDDLFTEYKISCCDFLKMDCEGAEVDILNSASSATWSKIRAITLEWHEDRTHTSLSDFVVFIRNHGFTVETSRDNHTLYAWR